MLDVPPSWRFKRLLGLEAQPGGGYLVTCQFEMPEEHWEQLTAGEHVSSLRFKEVDPELYEISRELLEDPSHLEAMKWLADN
jgi:hypothetical protein